MSWMTVKMDEWSGARSLAVPGGIHLTDTPLLGRKHLCEISADKVAESTAHSARLVDWFLAEVAA